MSSFLKEVSGIPRGTAMALTDLPSIATVTFLGNITGSSATPSALTATQVTANLNLFTSSLQGLTPSSGGGTTNYLRADGTWAAPPGSGTVTSVGMTVPTFLSVTPASITTSGTFAITLSGTALPIANGGTAATSFTAYAPVIGGTTSTGALQSASSGMSNSGYVLTSTGSSSSPTWQAASGSSPLTTKGDIYTYSTVNARQPVPGDYGRLIPDSTQSTGWRSAPYNEIQQGRPGKQYIQYADFENNSTTGWTLGTIGTLTNGLPTGSPTFGSGASGNLSLAATSTSIEGAYSLNYVSSAATTQGNMVASSSYAIDTEDQAKVLTVKFYYTAASGASNCNFSGTSSNSFAWAVYDVTNSSWLTSAGNFNLIQSSGCGYVTGTCQTNATTANVRLVVYNANATSGAATITLDGFYLGPQTAPNGPAMTDWQTYTLTIGAVTTAPSLGTNTSTALWRRVGDSMEVRFTFSQTTAGASAGSGTYLFPIAPGYTIDTTKVSVSTGAIGAGGTVVGPCQVSQTAAASTLYAFQGDVIPYNTTNLQMVIPFTTYNELTTVGSGFGSTANTTLYYSYTAKVPIVGWSSNSSMSSDTDTRVAAGAFHSTTGASMGTLGTSYTAVTWNATDSDTHGGYSSPNYTIPVTGYYNISSQILASGTGALNATLGIQIYNNTTSATIKKSELVFAGAITASTPAAVNVNSLYLTTGTQIQIQAIQSGYITNNAAYVTDTTQNYFTIARVCGPAVVAATESVNCRYTTAATTSIPQNTITQIVWTTKDFDSHNAMSTSTGNYTCPVSGKYSVKATGNFSATASGVLFMTGYVYHNGTTHSEAQISMYANSNSLNYSALVATTVSCLAGDTIGYYLDTNGTGGALGGNATLSYIAIERVGN